ncbi:transcriptional regulator [candidate division WOR-3 bacterium]|uniref:Transcriptional regulator n=1 Tax=candidate division WOR-3 bacterium TaxID=2052148 RepID=A0A9D5KB67_UNCW3|nr:transcriptional regulator [candidate division WOR-3 bacterium]MBD3364939.1 transcriptional regulator [candidate division WOR-3 bacterium]
MKVPQIDLWAHHEPLMEEFRQAMDRVVRSNQFILGQEEKDFEKACAEYLEVKHAIGVGNGTDALAISLRALGIGPGDEVITTPFTFIATCEVIVALGAKPVFVDIKPDTCNMDSAKIEPAITAKTKVILPVHLYGQAAEMDPILEIARKHGLKTLEDAAQAFGSTYKSRKVGGLGDVTIFSFFPTKNLGALGDGGLITTNDDDLYEKCRLIRVHGAPKKYYHTLVGQNSRLDTLQAAFLRIKLNRIDEYNQKRTDNAQAYSGVLKDFVGVPVTHSDCNHIFHQYTIRTNKRDELKQFLNQNAIGIGIHYPYPLHLQPVFKDLELEKGSFPEAEKAANEVMSLPVFPELTTEQRAYVIDKVKEFFS